MARWACLMWVAGLLVGQGMAQTIPPDKERVFDRKAPNVRLVDATGREFRLHDLRGKPVILSPIYTGCPSACIAITSSLRKVIPQVGVPGKDFWVLSLTFNPKERDADIRAFQRRYRIVEDGWRVAYAKTERELFQLLDAIDFRFRYVNEKIYDHPNVLVFLSDDLRIRYYVEGTNYTKEQILTGLRWARGELTIVERIEHAMLPIGVAILAGGALLSLLWGRFHRSDHDK